MKRGMVIFTRIQQHLPKADYYFFAVYSNKGVAPKSLKNFTHEPTLAPDKELFQLTQKLKASNAWNADTFWRIYAPRFRELMTKEPMKSSIDDLCAFIDAGYTVCVMCYCNNNHCHRFLLAEELKRRGYGAYVLGA